MKNTPGGQFKFFQARHGGPPRIRPATHPKRAVLGFRKVKWRKQGESLIQIDDAIDLFIVIIANPPLAHPGQLHHD
jgi:hypothetical protein